MVHWPPTWSTLLLVPALFLGFTVHEVAHALVAYLLGDTSQIERKRLSFNPMRHVSWAGLAVFLLLGFGWAKPVWVDPARFRIRNRAFGLFLVSISGAMANLLVAVVTASALFLTFLIVVLVTGAELPEVWLYFLESNAGPDLQGAVVALSTYVVTVNGILAFFNLLPFPPLDGFQAIVSLFKAIHDAVQGRRQVASGAPPREAAAPAPEVAAPSADGATSGDGTAPSPARIHFDIALDYQRRGELDEAIARYRQAISHDEFFDLAYYNLGLAYWAKGRTGLASSAFRAAMQSSRDVGVRIQSDLRLRELAQAEARPEAELRPAPPPLEPEAGPVAVEAPPPSLDAGAVRQVWLRFLAGGVALLALGVAAWLFVTIAACLALA